MPDLVLLLFGLPLFECKDTIILLNFHVCSEFLFSSIGEYSQIMVMDFCRTENVLYLCNENINRKLSS